jgi:hypothetical protein
LDGSSNSAASDKGHTGALYSKNGDRAAEVGMALFTTALGLYGGVLWDGELQGFIYMKQSLLLYMKATHHTLRSVLGISGTHDNGLVFFV